MFHITVRGSCLGSGCQLPTSHRGDLGSIPCGMCDGEIRSYVLGQEVFTLGTSKFPSMFHINLFIYYLAYIILATNSVVEVKKAGVNLIQNQSSLSGDTMQLVTHSIISTKTPYAMLDYLLRYKPGTQNIILLRDCSRLPRKHLHGYPSVYTVRT